MYRSMRKTKWVQLSWKLIPSEDHIEHRNDHRNTCYSRNNILTAHQTYVFMASSREKREPTKKARRLNKSNQMNNYKHPQKLTQSDVKKAHDAYIGEIISGDITNNPKRLWTYLKSKKQDQQEWRH